MKFNPAPFKKVLALAAMSVLASLSMAQATAVPAPAQVLKTQELSPAIIPFDLQWSAIQAFIDQHKVSSDPETEQRLKDETRSGYADWQCIGEGLGWPAAAEVTTVGMIQFDSRVNALLCSSMILTLALQQ